MTLIPWVRFIFYRMKSQSESRIRQFLQAIIGQANGSVHIVLRRRSRPKLPALWTRRRYRFLQTRTIVQVRMYAPKNHTDCTRCATRGVNRNEDMRLLRPFIKCVYSVLS